MACIRRGRLESPILPWRESLRLAEVSSRLIDHWGVRYPF
jgi:hypothetical protein